MLARLSRVRLERQQNYMLSAIQRDFDMNKKKTGDSHQINP